MAAPMAGIPGVRRTPDAGMARELAALCASDDSLLCAALRVRSPNAQALHDARCLARAVAGGEPALEEGESLGRALRRMYAASVEDQEAWGRAAAEGPSREAGGARAPSR